LRPSGKVGKRKSSRQEIKNHTSFFFHYQLLKQTQNGEGAVATFKQSPFFLNEFLILFTYIIK
jgi:hypothetical protein